MTSIRRLSALEVRHLLALQAVVEEGSFTTAACRLGYAQPTISAQIAGLERIVGESLIERRNGRPAALTAAGEAFYASAMSALDLLEAAGVAAAEALTAGARQLRLGTFTSAGARFLPPLLASLRRERPAVDLVLSEVTDVDVLEADVLSGRLDVAFALQPLTQPELESVVLAEDPYVLLVPAASDLTTRDRPPGPAELSRLPLIVSGSRRVLAPLEARMSLGGVEPIVAVRTDDDRLAHALVSAGSGVALLGRLQAEGHAEDTVLVDLGDLLPPRLVCVAWDPGRSRSRMAQELVSWALRASPSEAGQP